MQEGHVHVFENLRELFEGGKLSIANNIQWGRVFCRAVESFGKFLGCNDGMILCVWDGKFVIVR